MALEVRTRWREYLGRLPIADVPDNLSALNPKWWVRPSRILVGLIPRISAPIRMPILIR